MKDGIRPSKVEEDTRAEELPILWLLDSQGVDALEAKKKNSDAKVPVVRITFHINNSGKKDQFFIH